MAWRVFWGGLGVGGSGWGDLITFLIVRSWWFICMNAWSGRLVPTLVIAWGRFGGLGGAVITFLIVCSRWFMYMKWQYTYSSWSDICVAALCTLRGTWVDTFAATLFIFPVHEVTYVLLRCALFVVMSWYFCCYALDGSCMWSDISVDTSFILGVSSISLISATRGPGKSFIRDTSVYLYMLVMFETLYHLTTWYKLMATELTNGGRRKLLSKKSFGDDGAHNPLQIPLKVCFGRRPHGISWPFSNYRCTRNTASVQKSIPRCCWKCSFRQGPRAPVFGGYYDWMLKYEKPLM